MNIERRERLKILLSDQGRLLGWNVSSPTGFTCILLYHSHFDHLWDRYSVVQASNGQYRVDTFWEAKDLEVRTRSDCNAVVKDVLFRWSESDMLLYAKGLFVPSITWTMMDRIAVALTS